MNVVIFRDFETGGKFRRNMWRLYLPPLARCHLRSCVKWRERHRSPAL